MKHRISAFLLSFSLVLGLASHSSFAAADTATTIRTFIGMVAAKDGKWLVKSDDYYKLEDALKTMLKGTRKGAFKTLSKAVEKEYRKGGARVDGRICTEIRQCAATAADAGALVSQLSDLATKLKDGRGRAEVAGNAVGGGAGSGSNVRSNTKIEDFVALYQDAIAKVAKEKGLSTRNAAKVLKEITNVLKKFRQQQGETAYQNLVARGADGMTLVAKATLDSPGDIDGAINRLRYALANESGRRALASAWPTGSPQGSGALGEAGNAAASLTGGNAPAIPNTPQSQGKDTGADICKNNPRQVICRLAPLVASHQDDVTKRFAGFMWDRDFVNDGKSFIHKRIADNPADRKRKRAESLPLIAGWIASNPEKAAALYYVLEVSDNARIPRPAWFGRIYSDYKKNGASKVPGNYRDGVLRGLGKYTVENSQYGTSDNPAGSIGQDDTGSAASWIQNKFFSDATDVSMCFIIPDLMFRSKSCRDAAAEINEENPAAKNAPDVVKTDAKGVPQGQFSGKPGANAFGAGGAISGSAGFFGVYGPGVKDVLLINDTKADSRRYFSIRHLTVYERDANGNGVLVPKVGIADISQADWNPPDARIKLFNYSDLRQGKQSIEWDFGAGASDEKNKKSQGEKLTVELDGSGNIVLKDVNGFQAWSYDDQTASKWNADPKHKGSEMKTQGLNLGELEYLRLQNAKNRGDVVSIGGREYYRLLESERVGCAAFLRKDAADSVTNPKGGIAIGEERLSCFTKPGDTGDVTLPPMRRWGDGADNKHYSWDYKENSDGCHNGYCSHWELVEADTPVGDDDLAGGPPPKAATAPDKNPPGKTGGADDGNGAQAGQSAGDGKNGKPPSVAISACDKDAFAELQANNKSNYGNGIYPFKVKSGSKEWCAFDLTRNGDEPTNQFLLVVFKDKELIFPGVLACKDDNCIEETQDEIRVRTVAVDPPGHHITKLDLRNLDGNRTKLSDGTEVSISDKSQVVYHIPKDIFDKFGKNFGLPVDSVASFGEREATGVKEGKTSVTGFVLHLKDRVGNDKDGHPTWKNELSQIFQRYDAANEAGPIFDNDAARSLAENYVADQLAKDPDTAAGRKKKDKRGSEVWAPEVDLDLFQPYDRDSGVPTTLVGYQCRLAGHDETHRAVLQWKKESKNSPPHLVRVENPAVTNSAE